MLFTRYRSNPILPKMVIENINILPNEKMWMLAALIAAVFSANVASLLFLL